MPLFAEHRGAFYAFLADNLPAFFLNFLYPLMLVLNSGQKTTLEVMPKIRKPKHHVRAIVISYLKNSSLLKNWSV
jgi:hypothetical protein